MPTLTIKSADKVLEVEFVPGRSLRDILDETSLRVRSGCRGVGACGLCLVRIESGNLDEPALNERNYISEDRLAQGIRLACQTIPKSDMAIEILARAEESSWKTPPFMAGARPRRFPVSPLSSLPSEVKTPYGLAVDLGTTHISLSVCDLSNGKPVAYRYGLNPQTRFGSDVITRLVAASESARNARIMSSQVVDTIGQGLWDIASREGLDIHQVARLTLVGNTAMLALLSGKNYETLLNPKYWASQIDCLPDSFDGWTDALDIHPEATISFIQPLAGFVGSDLLVGLISADITRDGAPSLLIDFGTNSEIALWTGETLWVTSAAGGPAFEGSGLSCGLPVGPGAISRVVEGDNGSYEYSVIDGVQPKGICGSGLVDLVAVLLKTGRLSKLGRFNSPGRGAEFILFDEEPSISMTKADVDVFQRAKAAIGAGTEILLEQAGVQSGDLRLLCVGGAFGSYLDIANAQTIGLLPQINPHLVELCGNTALAGCEEVMIAAEASDYLESIRSRARLINLSDRDDFEDIYWRSLYLQASQ